MSHLCKACQLLDLSTLIEQSCVLPTDLDQGFNFRQISHHESTTQLFEAADSGCGFCALVKSTMLALFPQETTMQLSGAADANTCHIRFDALRCHPEFAPVTAACWAFTYVRGGFGNGAYCRFVMADISCKSKTTGYVGLRLLNETDTGAGGVSWREWIADCQTNHKDCSRDGTVYLPTRVIEVGDGVSPPRLVSTKGRRGTYAALSHCWGLVKPLVTTSASLPDYLCAIDLYKWPPTFRDALQVCRELRIPYLWIDSLCIIQDSDEDWQQECKVMHLVYANATLTIAADEGSSAYAGLFSRREQVSSDGCELELSWRSIPSSTKVRISHLPDSKSGLVRVYYYEQTALSRRGWVLQERLMSRRVLHFNDGRTAFECRSGQRADNFTHPLPISYRNTYIGSAIPLDSLEGEDENTVMSRWYLVVARYTDCSLTEGKDRLPAISAIARVVSERFGKRYLAGVWEDDIALGLSWRRETTSNLQTEEENRILRPTQCPAPSWSWASAAYAIGYGKAVSVEERRHLDYDSDVQSILSANLTAGWVDLPCVKLLDSHIDPLSDDAFAEIVSGELSLEGRIQPIRVEELSIGAGRVRPAVLSDDDPVPKGGFVPDSNGTRVDPVAPLCCLLLAVARYVPRFAGRNLDCSAVVIEPVLGRTATFRRIGALDLLSPQFRGLESQQRCDNRDKTAAEWLSAARKCTLTLV